MLSIEPVGPTFLKWTKRCIYKRTNIYLCIFYRYINSSISPISILNCIIIYFLSEDGVGIHHYMDYRVLIQDTICISEAYQSIITGVSDK
jgi:hypothetical protein